MPDFIYYSTPVTVNVVNPQALAEVGGIHFMNEKHLLPISKYDMTISGTDNGVYEKQVGGETIYIEGAYLYTIKIDVFEDKSTLPQMLKAIRRIKQNRVAIDVSDSYLEESELKGLISILLE